MTGLIGLAKSILMHCHATPCICRPDPYDRCDRSQGITGLIGLAKSMLAAERGRTPGGPSEMNGASSDGGMSARGTATPRGGDFDDGKSYMALMQEYGQLMGAQKYDEALAVTKQVRRAAGRGRPLRQAEGVCNTGGCRPIAAAAGQGRLQWGHGGCCSIGLLHCSNWASSWCL